MFSASRKRFLNIDLRSVKEKCLFKIYFEIVEISNCTQPLVLFRFNTTVLVSCD